MVCGFSIIAVIKFINVIDIKLWFLYIRMSYFRIVFTSIRAICYIHNHAGKSKGMLITYIIVNYG